MLCSISLGSSHIIITKCKKVLFAAKVNRYNWPNKIGLNVLVRLYCSWLRVVIIPFLGFGLFVVIVDKSPHIVDIFNIVVCKIFFPYGEV